MSQAGASRSPTVSLSRAAARGGLLTAMQVVVNKALSMAGMLAVTYLLAPEQVGIAGVALSVQSLVMVMPAFTLSDVLIARPDRARALLPSARRLCMLVSIPMVASLVAWGILKSGSGAPREYLHAGLIVAVQPIVDLLLLGPQTRLRSRLAFSRIARIDTVCYAASTALTVAMAATGFGSASILLPPIAFTGVRAGLYHLAERRDEVEQQSAAEVDSSGLLRDYFLSGLGQYAHYGLIMATPLVLDHLFGERTVGLFRNAFLLSTVVNSVVATGIGIVLQPIFAQMHQDPCRQSQAFIRSCAVIAAVSMPACLAQAALIGPVLRLLLPPAWSEAAPMAAVMSAGQALYFAVNPAMALLKAQGRFPAFLAWQAMQFAVVVLAMMWIGRAWPDGGAIAVIAIYGLYHVVSSPAGIALCVRGSGLASSAIGTIILRPMLASIIGISPILALRWLLGSWLAPTPADIVLLVLSPIVALPTCVLMMRKICPATFAECERLIAPLLGRFGVRAAT